MSIDGKPVSNAIVLTALAILGTVPVAAVVYLYRVVWG